jgi:hypothetical protein
VVVDVMVSFARPIPKKPVSDYELRRHVEDMDRIRRSTSNTPVQREEANALMLHLEGEIHDRMSGVLNY